MRTTGRGNVIYSSSVCSHNCNVKPKLTLVRTFRCEKGYPSWWTHGELSPISAVTQLYSVLTSVSTFFWFPGNLVNIVEDLAAKETDIFFSGVGGDQTRAKRRVNIGLTFIRRPETCLQINDIVAVSASCKSRQLLTRYKVIMCLCCVFAPKCPEKINLRFWLIVSLSWVTISCIYLIHNCWHFFGNYSLAFFLAVLQDGDVPLLNPAYKALIGSVVFPTRKTALHEHSALTCDSRGLEWATAASG